MMQRKTVQTDVAKTAAEQATATTEPSRNEAPTSKPTEGHVILILPEQELKFHEATRSIPIRKCDVDALANSIGKNGQFLPILLCDGKIIAGRCRYLACRQLGIPCKAIELKDLGGRTPTKWVLVELRESGRMRHLTESQLALVAARNIPDHYGPEAKERMKNGTASPDKDVAGTACEIAAAEFPGLKPNRVKQAWAVVNRDIKDLEEAVVNGLPITTAAKIAKYLDGLRDDKQRQDLLAAAQKADKQEIKKLMNGDDHATDVLGQNIPDKLKEHFKAARECGKYERMLLKIAEWVHELHTLGIAESIKGNILQDLAEDLKRFIPACVCTACGAKNNDCSMCDGRGLLYQLHR